MNKRDILMLAIGAVAGGAVTAAVGYFAVYRHYIPFRDLEAKINELENRKRELSKELGYMEDPNESDEDPVAEEDPVSDDPKATAYVAFTHPYSSMFKPGEPDDEEADEEALDDYQSIEVETNDPPGHPSGNYVISTGYPRVDGVLSAEQQRQYEECNGDERLIGTLIDGIMEERFDDTIDDEYPIYQIDSDLHESAPWFIDTVRLDYYEEDDILAEDRTIVDNVDRLINPIVLNHFGPNSLSGDPNVVWCRNDILKIDYEITKHPGSYQNEVLGIPKEMAYDPPRKFNKERADLMEERYGSKQ